MRFKFNAKKSAQAANWFLRRSGGCRNYMELVKLLYLSDRTALLNLESPITGDRFASLPYSPVVSRILNLIRFGPIDGSDAPWFDAVSPPGGYDVEAKSDAGESELSGAELQILNEIFVKYGRMDWKELSDATHDLPEWVDPDGGAITITPEQILAIGGKSPEQVEYIKQQLDVFDHLDRELAAFTGAQ